MAPTTGKTRITIYVDVKDKLVSALLDPVTTTSQEFVAFLKAEASRWSQVIKTVGIKAE